MLTLEEKERIKTAIVKKIAHLNCPMCKSSSFTMSDGYFLNTLQEELKGVTLGGQAIPTISLICNTCGFVSQHALGVLGLLPKNDIENEPK